MWIYVFLRYVWNIWHKSGIWLMGLCYRWLRSPGNNSNNAAYVDNGGCGNNNGNNVDNSKNAVRPDLHRIMDGQTIARNLSKVGKVCAYMQRNRIPSHPGNMPGMGEYIPSARGTAGNCLSDSCGAWYAAPHPAAMILWKYELTFIWNGGGNSNGI